MAHAHNSAARLRTRALPRSLYAKRTTALLSPLQETRLGQNRRLTEERKLKLVNNASGFVNHLSWNRNLTYPTRSPRSQPALATALLEISGTRPCAAQPPSICSSAWRISF